MLSGDMYKGAKPAEKSTGMIHKWFIKGGWGGVPSGSTTGDLPRQCCPNSSTSQPVGRMTRLPCPLPTRGLLKQGSQFEGAHQPQPQPHTRRSGRGSGRRKLCSLTSKVVGIREFLI